MPLYTACYTFAYVMARARPKKTRILLFRVDFKTYKSLEKCQVRTDEVVPMSTVLREAVQEYLKKHEASHGSV